MAISVRLATLQDTEAICAVHRSHVAEWRSFNSPDQPLVPYDKLSLFERWQHGGPWLSVETCAVHIYRLLLGAGTPLVAESDGIPFAEAEVYDSDEAAPFEHCLHLAVLCTHADKIGRGLGSALLDYAMRMARAIGSVRLTYSGDVLPEFYSKRNFRPLQVAVAASLSTHAGRAVYQTTPLTDANPAQIRGWHMPLGRYRAARQEWDALFPAQWATGIPELLDVPAAQLKLTVAGQNTFVSLRETSPGVCDLACWSARPLNAPLITALRDCARGEGFHTINTLIAEASWPLLQAADAELTGLRHTTYELRL